MTSGPGVVVHWVPVTDEIVSDGSIVNDWLNTAMAVAIDRNLNPWNYPDPAPSWTFEPFPRVARILTRIAALGQTHDD